MIYKFKNQNTPKDFRYYLNPVELYTSLRDGDICHKEILENRKRFKLDLNEIGRGKWRHKSQEQNCVTKNVRMFYKL